MHLKVRYGNTDKLECWVCDTQDNKIKFPNIKDRLAVVLWSLEYSCQSAKDKYLISTFTLGVWRCHVNELVLNLDIMKRTLAIPDHVIVQIQDW